MIASQVEEQFGANGYYLVDFYHVCDYLSAAAKAIHLDAGAAGTWMDVQKILLKNQQAETKGSTLCSPIWGCKRSRYGRPGTMLSSLSDQAARSTGLSVNACP